MLQYKKNEEYDVKKVLYDYGQMQYESGLASGRWEKNEYTHDETSNIYLSAMKSYAKDYQIDYDHNLDSYKEYDDEEESITIDRMAFDIQCLVEKKMIDILLKNL